MYDVYKNSQITLPRTSLAQSKIGIIVKKDALIVGDLLFFDTSNKGHINHTGIYIGDHKFIHASSGKKSMRVVISSLNKPFYKKSYRFAKRVADKR